MCLPTEIAVSRDKIAMQECFRNSYQSYECKCGICPEISVRAESDVVNCSSACLQWQEALGSVMPCYSSRLPIHPGRVQILHHQSHRVPAECPPSTHRVYPAECPPSACRVPAECSPSACRVPAECSPSACRVPAECTLWTTSLHLYNTLVLYTPPHHWILLLHV